MAPALSDDVTEAVGLKESNSEQGNVVKKLWYVSPEPNTSDISAPWPQETQKTRQIGETWQER